ncbi:MAG: DDE-type integrase/transposase/recombinase [Cyanobacteria bacterium P01_A01_bin.3]
MNGSYVKAIAELKQSGELPESCKHRPVKYLQNIVEQDHRFVWWRVKASQHFKNFWSAQRTLRGYETINMIRKGQLNGVARGDVVAQNDFVDQLFGISV